MSNAVSQFATGPQVKRGGKLVPISRPLRTLYKRSVNAEQWFNIGETCGLVVVAFYP